MTAEQFALQSDYVLSSAVQPARERLTDWACALAEATAFRTGFHWLPLPDAPSTYPELCAAYAHCLSAGTALPVSSEHSGSVIFTSPEANYAWRFVHDVTHVERGLTFSLVDEFDLALVHLRELERRGFTSSSVEYALLKADTLGQVLVNAMVHRFPGDQERFDLECHRYGFDHGVLRELRREAS